MITITRTISIAPGKLSDALSFAHQIAKHMKEKHGTSFEVQMPIGGNPSRIAWMTRYDTLAQWETLNAKILGDKEYLELLSKQSSTFLPGSVHDEIWRSI